MIEVKIIGIIFTQIALECFKEDIVGERVDSRPWGKPVCTNSVLVILRKDGFCRLPRPSLTHNISSRRAIYFPTFEPLMACISDSDAVRDGYIVMGTDGTDDTDVQFQVSTRQLEDSDWCHRASAID